MAQTFKYGNGVWATKEGSSLAFNDQDGHYKPLPFTTTRASSATRVNKQGLIEVVGNDRARIDYSETSKGALLLEPARTNLITYSEDYSQSEWTNASYTKDATITYNSDSIAPDGTLGVYQYECTVSGSNSQLGAVKTVSSGVAYISSVYLRRINGTGAVKLRDVNNTEKDITADLTSDWKRFEITGTSSSTVGRVYINVLNSGDIIEVWGAQLEAGSYATSYIPTSGSTSTRQADTATGAGVANVFNDSEGVFFIENSTLQSSGEDIYISISDGTASNRITLRNTAAINNVVGQCVVGGVNQASMDYTLADRTTNNKVCIKYKVNDFALWANGFEVVTDTSGSTPTGLNVLDFDNGGGAADWYGKTKQIGYYDAVLTDAELEYLTSYRSWEEMVTELNLTIK